MRVLANTTPIQGGQTVLLDLRRYPTMAALYAAGLGALYRRNYSALRAVTVDAKFRKDGELIPVIGVCHTWAPYSGFEAAASLVARETDGQTTTDQEIRDLNSGKLGRRHTPASDHLHAQLRDTLRPVIHDAVEYTETFDELEVLLALVAADAKLQAKDIGVSLYGAWVGAYSWRDRYSKVSAPERMQKQFESAGSAWEPLQAGLFGSSAERAEAAFATFLPHASDERSRMF
jgi:hypothetical protein